MRRVLPLSILLCLGACSEVPEMLDPCDPDATDTVCAVLNPEDMDVIPDSQWIVFSEMLSEADPDGIRYGSLQLMDTNTRELRPLFGKDAVAVADHELAPLGDPSCPGEPDPARFGGHGLDLRRLADGTVLLAAVNHGDRESIELFSIEEGGEHPSALWRGCIPLERESIHNDVAIAADGSLYFTRFITNPHHTSFALLMDFIKLSFGADTGFVYRWSQSDGLQVLPDSEGSAPNGISIAPTDDVLFVAEWGEEKVYTLRLNDETISREEIELDFAPDNFAWSPGGKLTVTGQVGDPSTNIACVETIPTTCNIQYSVYELDPATLSLSKLMSGVGSSSIALPVGRELYVGSFTSDNIQVHPYAP